MKRFLILWVVVCLAVTLLPKAIDRFTPKVIIKEVPVIKEVVKEVIKEVPVYKDEKIVEKVVYQPLQDSIFAIEKVSDDEYTVRINSPDWNGTIVEVTGDKDRIYFKRKRYNNNCVSMSSVGFN
ncbi:MAG: hypothetical protein V1709_10795 [Planctomycetota bacterium]